MSAFELNGDMIRVISSEFGLSPEGVKGIYDEYSLKINDLMIKQYLGHSIRALEQFAYSERGISSFRVRCEELPGCPCPVCLDYGDSFIIYYPSDLDEKDVRFSIAHELGHLFFNTQSRKGVYDATDQKTLEAVANVFGLLVIFGRNSFYSEKKDPFQNAAWQRTITEYAKVCK